MAEIDTYELVGRYVEAEREYALLVRHMEGIKVHIELGEDVWYDEKKTARMAELETWMAEVRSKLPNWYDPNFLTSVTEDFATFFSDGTKRLNDIIHKRRASGVSFKEPTYDKGQQDAYEWLRKRIYNLWEKVAFRGTRKPIQPWTPPGITPEETDDD